MDQLGRARAELRAELGDTVPTDAVESVVRRVLSGPGDED